MNKIKLLILLLVGSWVNINAQDPHFSVFYGIPTGLNPAYTGNFNGNFRVGAQYRDQWNSILSTESVSAYRTSVVSLEARTNRGIDEKDFIGMGAYFMYDVAGQSRLSNTKFGLSGSYRKALDQYGDHFIAVGGQLAFIQKRIDLQNLTWGSQWDGTQYVDDPNLSETQNLDNNLIFYDLSGGLSWGYNHYGTRNRFFAGVGVMHINEPVESFVKTNDESTELARLPMKININGGAGLELSKSMDVMPKFLYMTQGQSMETILGSDLRFILDASDEDASNSVYIGALTRLVGGDPDNVLESGAINLESVIITGRVDYNNFEVGAAYDINVSDLTRATKYQGGFEIYFNYVFRITSNRQQKMFCPKF